MKSFEEQFVHEFYMGKNNKGEYIDDRTRMASFCYEAGQQSRQAEVDELQKRIDEAIAILSSKKKMYVDMVIEVEKALKGGNK